MNKHKILLASLPFWTPLVPSQGIATLKSFLQQYGYNVKAVDLAAKDEFLEFYREYFDTVKKFIPLEKRGNFYNIGHDVLRNHMMAHTNYKNEKEYIELVKILVYKTYYCKIDDTEVLELNQIIGQFFEQIKAYFLNLLEEEKPSVLGLSVTSGNLPTANFIFKLTRAHYPHIQTVMGGCIFFNHLAVGNPDLDFFLEKTKAYIDKIVVGKGEVLFLKILKGELPGAQRTFTPADIKGEDLTSYHVPLPDLTDYNLANYFYLSAAGSGSCPFNCSFCNVATYFGKFRKRDPVQVVKEMITLHEKYGHRLFFMNDSLLNLVITDISKEFLKTDVSLYMDGYFIVDDQAGDIENTLLWRQGGFYRARFGAESGSQRMLDIIGKKITPRQTRSAVSGMASAGIKTTTYWVIGHPGETEEDFQQTLDLVEELKNDIWQAECNPFTYSFVGQTKADEWAGKRRLLYPAEARDMLISQTWIMDCEPSREETYERVFRFVQHCNKLGIPNPYSFADISKADSRWKKLHKNAVPSIAELINNEVDIAESKQVKKLLRVQRHQDNGDFGF